MADPRPSAAWEAQEREQRVAWLRLTPRQRLDWLWQAKLFVLRVEAAGRRPPPAVPSPPGGGRIVPGSRRR